MLKNIGLRKMSVTFVSLLLIGMIYLFPTKDKIKVSESINYIDEDNLSEVFLIDKNNYVSEVSVNVVSEELKDKINEKLEVLILDSKDNKPKGFNGIIPSGTKVLSISLDGDICQVDFSKDILNIKKQDEDRMIEAIVYTLTSFNEIKKVKILVEGVSLTKLPSGKVISDVLDRGYGINKNYDINSLNELNKTTVYYTAQENDLTYFVPVTKITNNKDDKVMVIVNELKSSILYQSNLSSYLNSKAELKKYSVEEEVMNLTFNDKIFDSIYDKNILEEVVYTIGKSVKENYDVKEVNFYVNDEMIAKF